MYLPKGHTTHYRQELSTKHTITAENKSCSKQTRTRIAEHRRVLPIYQFKTGTVGTTHCCANSMLPLKTFYHYNSYI